MGDIGVVWRILESSWENLVRDFYIALYIEYYRIVENHQVLKSSLDAYLGKVSSTWELSRHYEVFFSNKASILSNSSSVSDMVLVESLIRICRNEQLMFDC